jgi:hypothetical protein
VAEIADPRTGELPDERVQPFAELMTLLDKGEVHAEASRALHDLVAAVADVGKPGTLTITVKLAPLKGSSEQLIVSAQVSAKAPKSEPSNAIFWVDKGGALVRNDPHQPVIDGLRIVEPKAARVVGQPEN